MSPPRAAHTGVARRLAWFLALWLAGVAAMALVTFALRALLSPALIVSAG